MNLEPRSFRTSAIRKSRSGRVRTCTTSNGRRLLEIESQALHRQSADGVLPHVGANAAGCEAKRKSMDANTLELNVGLEVAALSLRTDDIDIVSRACKRSSLAPDAAIERYREVLDEHEDACRVVSARE